MRVGTVCYATSRGEPLVKREPGVYCILNLRNGKRYIGSGVCVARRFKEHRISLRSGTHKNKHLQSAWKAYGEISFEFLVLRYCPSEDCLPLEQHYIDLYKSYDRENGYNKNPKAGSMLGFKHSEETKRRLSKIVKRHFSEMTLDERRKANGSHLKRNFSAESRARISAANLGRKHTEKTLAKMRRLQKTQAARKGTTEVRAKLRAAWVLRKLRCPGEKEVAGWIKSAESNRGRKRSKQFREALSQRTCGVPKSEECKRKISETLTGRKLSEQHKAAIKAGLARRRVSI